ncbi:MAG: SDR family oxidoreductase [Proteobacteria bacterium]|nr:SDR family oxidoreductase [Pseudomonadota bacterium]
MKSLEGKIALVTGGAGGIGKAAALLLAREGAKVVVNTGSNIKGGEEVVRLIKEKGGEAIFVQGDVSKTKDVENLIDKAVKTYGRLDYAVNNAGVIPDFIPTAETSEESWDRTINVDLKGVWLCMKYEILQMLKQGGGSIVNVSSAVGLVGSFGVCPYVASKHGVVGLTKAAALEYAKAGIRVNAVCPGSTETPGFDKTLELYPQVRDITLAICPMGRMGEPEEIAEAIVWLCSDKASYVTGHAMVVDGGMIAQ